MDKDFQMIEKALEEFKEELAHIYWWEGGGDLRNRDVVINNAFEGFKKLLDRFFHETKTKE